MDAPHAIGDVAQLTGLPIATLRAWETRYRVVEPHRHDNGIRRYDDEQVARLRRMRELVEGGIPPRKAAQLLDTTPGAPPVSALLDHEALLRSPRDPQALEALIDRQFAQGKVETVIDQWLMPSLRRVGEAWSSGELDVATEHLISAAVMHRLAAFYAATRASGPRVAVGLPAKARHELPALALALCLRRLEVNVIYLGADVPAQSWQVVAHRYRPAAAVVGVATVADVDAGQQAVRACHAAGLRHVFVGGRAASGVDEAITLPGALSDAAAAIAATVAKA